MMIRRRTTTRLGGFIIRHLQCCAYRVRWHRRWRSGWARRRGRRGSRRWCGMEVSRTSAKLRRLPSIWCLRRGVDARRGPFLLLFDDYCGAVGQDFGDALHDFVGVVAEGDDGVGSELGGVKGHHGEGVLTGLLAELGEEGDVSADEGLEVGAKGDEDVAGTHDNAANNAEIADDAVAGDFERSGGEGWVESEGWGWVGRHLELLLYFYFYFVCGC